MRRSKAQLLVPRWLAALSGVAAAGFGLGIAEIVAGLSSKLRSPVLDVGDRVVDGVPGWAKDLAISWFGTNDKLALLVGIAVLVTLFAALLGTMALRNKMMLALIGVGLFAVVGSLAALGARSQATWYRPLPTLVGAAVAGGSLFLLERQLRPLYGTQGSEDDVPKIAALTNRRRALGMTGALVVGAVVSSALGRRLDNRFSAAGSRSGLDLPLSPGPLEPVSAGVQAPGAAPFITPNADFYRIDTALSVPQVPADGWSLKITGMVDQEIEISYADLLGRELIERDITLTCVSNTIGGELVGTARWLGTRLDDLLAEAGIDPSADQIVGRSVDGYTCGFPVAALDGRDALVAIGMNGEPLPLAHGFPARLIVPGLYGYVSATKWLSEIDLTRFDQFDHYWVPRGYAVEAPIKLQSRIDTPRGLDRIPSGPFVIGGVAWAQTIGIDGVEVKIDDGRWTPAVLADELNDVTWRQWSLSWEATPGRHTISVRATDRNGTVQTDERTEPLPNGASGHHTVVVLVDEA